MFNFLRQLINVIRNPPNPNWHIEEEAKPSKTHPLGGFWKKKRTHTHGLAIGPAKDDEYFVTFCGPGGCFEKGAYRADTPIEGDPNYRVIDKNTIEVRSRKGKFSQYVRVKSREGKASA